MMGEKFYHQREAEDPDKERVAKFKEFIEANKFTADQVLAAYHKFLGISAKNEQGPIIEKISNEIRRLADEGLALNHFARLIGAKQEQEDSVPRYYQFVESLHFSPKEKGILRSLVEKRRNGRMEFYLDGEVIAEFDIKTGGVPVEILAGELTDIFQKILKLIPQGKNCSFAFMEN